MLQTPCIVLPVLRGLTPPGPGGPAGPSYSLVGTIGAVAQGTTTSSPAWGASESRTAGNLLVCWVGQSGQGAAITLTGGWTALTQSFGASGPRCALFYKIAAGADAAPTVSNASSFAYTYFSRLAEFSGNAATPLEQQGVTNGSALSTTVTNGGTDVAFGNLVISAALIFNGNVASGATNTYNNGATATSTFASDGGSHFVSFAWGTTSGAGSPASADNDAVAFTASASGPAIVAAIASFK